MHFMNLPNAALIFTSFLPLEPLKRFPDELSKILDGVSLSPEFLPSPECDIGMGTGCGTLSLPPNPTKLPPNPSKSPTNYFNALPCLCKLWLILQAVQTYVNKSVLHELKKKTKPSMRSNEAGSDELGSFASSSLNQSQRFPFVTRKTHPINAF